MRENQNICIHGHKVVLVPYRKSHVEKYHVWMQSPELQELTASEPLTLDEEYAMQRSWAEDPDKCTFIILEKEAFYQTDQREEDEMKCMAGDVNLFFNDQDDRQTAEIEIMIAEISCRGRGMGKEALMAMMKYGVDELHVNTYTAKIGLGNASSLGMFTKLGFKEISRSEVFQEVTLSLPVERITDQLHKDTAHLMFKQETEGAAQTS